MDVDVTHVVVVTSPEAAGEPRGRHFRAMFQDGGCGLNQ
jgi:hypothetical protein